MKITETNKLYYNKYVYRLNIRCALSTIFRHKDLSKARSSLDHIQQCAEAELPLYIPNRFFRNEVTLEDFQDACLIFSYLKNYKDDYLVRVESAYMNIYSNQDEWLKELGTKVDAKELNQPITDNIKDYLLANKNTQIVNGPVYYEYKVYCGTNIDPSFANFCKVNKDKIKVGNKALEDFSNGWSYGHYFYAKNEKTIALVNMFCRDKLRRIVKLVSKENLDK